MIASFIYKVAFKAILYKIYFYYTYFDYLHHKFNEEKLLERDKANKTYEILSLM